MNYYEKYDIHQTFVRDFIKFSQFYRNDYNVPLPTLWPLEKLYLVLNDMDSGFFIEKDHITCLGLEIENHNDGICRIIYRDPFYPEPKEFLMNIWRLRDNYGRYIKIQWFGNFITLHRYKLTPSFSKLAEYGFKYELPKNQELLTLKEPFLCGDICAFLAKNGKTNFLKIS